MCVFVADALRRQKPEARSQLFPHLATTHADCASPHTVIAG